MKVNDACEFNTQTNLNSTKTVLSTDASTNTDCNDVTYNDVWYKIVVPTNGQIYVFTEKIDNTFAGGGMALLRGTCSSMTTVKCIASTTKMPSLNVTTGLTPGETLYLRLWGTTSSDIGNFKLCVSSPPVCTSNPSANDNCSNATLICNLNGYCGNTAICNATVTTNCYTKDQPNNLLTTINNSPGGGSVSIENNSWLAFTAASTSASFTVYVSGCAGSGIQLGVFDAADCNNFSIRSAFFNGYKDPFVVTANNLVPGNKYLIMIDGSSGDVCQYKIAAAYGFSTSTAGPDQTVCSGSTVTLQASGPTGATFTWKQGATTIGTGASLVLNPSPTATTTYTVEITGSTLCSPFTDEVIINVENCCPTLTLPNDNQRICKDGTPTKFSVKTTETSANGVKFVYFTSQQTGTAMYTGGTLLGNATIVGGMAYYTPTSLGTSGSLPNVAGDYYVYALLATPSGPTCKPFQEIKVTVYEPPVVTVNNPTICVGETATITATVVPAGSYNYSWTVPSGFTNPGNVASFTTTTPGSYTVSVTNKSLICNTDFDDVNLSILNNIKLENEYSVPCWKTSATDDIIEFWGNGFNSVPSYSGNQFVELNATQASTLYQDFTMTPNSTVEISFAHRGRDGVDVMKVEIGPVGGPYENLGTFSDGNTAWGYYSINYTFPNSGSTNYRIQFTAVSSTGGGASFGNFLDAISIKNFACPILPATGTLTTGSPILNITDPATVCPGTTVDLTANSITATSTDGLTFTYWMNAACTTPIPAAN